MADRSKGREEAVNLGLSEILARESARVSDTPVTRREETAVFALTDGDVAFDREFVSLAEARKWGVLVSRAEQSIANADDLEARLWWIRGHLGALSLPVSLLAAPFETVCRQLRPEDATALYRNLILEIGSIMLSRLSDVGDARQAQRVREALVALGLGAQLSPVSNGIERRNGIPPLAPVFSTPTQVEPRAQAQISETSQPHRRLGRVLLTSGVVALLALFVFFGVGLFSDGNVVPASDGLVAQSAQQSQELPLVRAQEVSGSLGALYYSLSTEKVDPSVAPPHKQPDNPSTAAPASARAPVSPGATKSKAPTQAKGKESVRTDGPIETPEVMRPPEMPRPGEPRLPPPELALRGDGTGVQQGEVRSNFPDGVASSSEGAKVVLVRTHVLVTGSHHARVLSILEPGDRVQVEGTLGRWLRIRSRKGKVGYVFAADVGDVEDFTSPSKEGR
jgi:hypothetical protein